MKRITILGSTGSIGRNALDIVSSHRSRFKVAVLTAGDNVDLLEKQIKSFSPDVVALADETAASKLQKRIGKKHASSLQILSGQKGIAEAATYNDSDFVLSAIVGAAGLIPTMSAIRSGKTIGLANKEALVMAGKIMIKESKKYRARILPVDSEHSAIFQCIQGHRKSDVRRIILTASGGPFAGKSIGELDNIEPEDALKHPRWKMGKKITIDSATLMNKGFEVIEAHYLFGLPQQKIDVLIHPQSIVHSLVEFNDRSCIAQLSIPDMKGPISYALSYPERLEDAINGLEFDCIESLTFKKTDNECFPCLSYAYTAIEAGGTMPSVLNAANEVAVNAFLKGAIRFTEIPVIIRKTMDHHTVMPDTELNVVMEADRWAREMAEEVIKSIR
ncbi:MAG: 1-deoxy-D-xylulose-5-phosphate reductoisomerase [Nitrospirae bacterium CG_4_10_14_0_8_um_filter_41_23]|nr:1-deoxy-D-xylulose-5-phosphate reductoisomerase [Nitrospirota bacterium]OIP58617.1 MAG: 1-deoxy-D-xylulose-5-phosphate reductoisomerase [Nitrospirae bacterium CG2_30_41_42]PIQ94882.1 MAG: 1-deoxy-D-xylulose-5-phosphate reductoisomerase [Nitrospirae bacterium CG11_big_fil_rev_8_21_14_0_20_41_14]PIV44037.1 MAG: 1-deoxy-D-xylulose-5-phosphate reductoisomerase [Nitrospirae bacterium CG02_land_8_20_14_3_00_41_53]PIW87529.1 MAG: 1-deoxy-D-xylulose-5-phosphate reductoisomerase [Nitrospirae bacteriu